VGSPRRRAVFGRRRAATINVRTWRDSAVGFGWVTDGGGGRPREGADRVDVARRGLLRGCGAAQGYLRESERDGKRVNNLPTSKGE
jgi:hypothetical protein